MLLQLSSNGIQRPLVFLTAFGVGQLFLQRCLLSPQQIYGPGHLRLSSLECVVVFIFPLSFFFPLLFERCQSLPDISHGLEGTSDHTMLRVLPIFTA